MTLSTKGRILDAAEELFAEQGFSATSLRHITARARVNLAAVNYHFGTKDALVEAVFARRLIPMNKDRLQRLDRLVRAHAPQDPPLDRLIEAFIAPALELSRHATEGGARFLKLLGRSYTEPSALLQEQVREMYREVIDRFRPVFAQVLPDLPGDELYWRLHFLVGVLAYCMSGADMMRLIASCRVHDSLDTNMLTQRLTVFLTAGMRAPLPAVDAPTLPETAHA
ncbi:MAG: TetR family transcriptional regulator [Gammaproteobacteria bacterium]|nr:TetR family transcriptional regulator [Gammaproteobacteria bacterium]